MGEPMAVLEVEERIARLVLNRPDRRNALSVALLEALHARVDELEAMFDRPDGGPRVLVVAGAGKAFCAGMDLDEVVIRDGNEEVPHALLSSLGRLTLRLRALPAVTLAAVNGAAIGGGCGLACACDVAATHADARLGFPEVDLGLCPAVVGPWVVRKVGAGRARRVLLMGGVMSGADALAAGLIDLAAEDRAGFEGLVEETAGRLAAGGPRALAATKGLLNGFDGIDASLMERAALLSAEVLATEEAQATLRAQRG